MALEPPILINHTHLNEFGAIANSDYTTNNTADAANGVYELEGAYFNKFFYVLHINCCYFS